ncbi:unnamed protein product, partial [Ixodes hexagonus]
GALPSEVAQPSQAAAAPLPLDVATTTSSMAKSEGLRDVFALLDKDCDLELCFEELKMALRALGLAVTEAQCDDLKRDLENDTGKSSVDYMGFLGVLAKMEYENLFKPEPESVRESVERALQLLDPQ